QITKTIADNIEEKLNRLEGDIKNMDKKFRNMEQKLDNFEQKEKLNNICIYGMSEEIDVRLLRILSQNSEMELKSESIQSAFRIGKHSPHTQRKPRSIIVKFTNFEQKNKRS
ncbi:hypothetical protein JTB14_034889, partial [Gonioctena quinquepunctata]